MTPRRGARRFGAVALDLLFPQPCVCCGRELAPGTGRVPLCESCHRALRRQQRTPAERCGTCGTLLIPEQESPCHSCRATAPAFRSHESLFDYGGVVEEVLHAFKFRGYSGLAWLLADLIAPCVVARYGDATVVPVPARPQRIRRYGYDTVDQITRALRTRYRLPVRRLLRRTGGRQQKSLDQEARRRNVHGRFRLRLPPPADRPLLVIDDVYTTGATVGECASVLRASGATSVYALTVTQD